MQKSCCTQWREKLTICIPKRPFEIIAKYLQYVFIFSWIPLFGIAIYGFIINGDATFFIGMFFGIPSFLIFIVWFYDENDKNEWIKWCDKK